MKSKKHYKLYKSGKQWKTLAITAAVAIAGVVSFDITQRQMRMLLHLPLLLRKFHKRLTIPQRYKVMPRVQRLWLLQLTVRKFPALHPQLVLKLVVAPVSAESVSVSAVASSATSSAS
ncbi:KxYKxGKxW signal peptide domain-containing protein [Limosilactobacillus fermentum]